MRILTLVRHAKASRDDAALTDFERPLTDRGRRDAPAMAQRMAEFAPRPERLVSSPASRAITTARLFASELEMDADEIVLRPRIYDASARTLLRLACEFDDSDRHVALFGHNPGISQFAHELGRCNFADMPTCAFACFELEIKTWADLAPGCGKLVRYGFPKQEKN